MTDKPVTDKPVGSVRERLKDDLEASVNGPSRVDLNERRLLAEVQELVDSGDAKLVPVPNEPILPEFLRPTGLDLPRGISFERWEAIGNFLGHIERTVAWWVGDWVSYGEAEYGEKYSQALEDTGLRYGTLANAAWVASRIERSRRREALSFAHHQEVAPLDPELQDEWLDRAEAEGWKRSDLRREMRRGQGHAVDRELWERVEKLLAELDDLDPEAFRQDERRLMASRLRGWADRLDPPPPEALFDVPARKPDWA